MLSISLSFRISRGLSFEGPMIDNYNNIWFFGMSNLEYNILKKLFLRTRKCYHYETLGLWKATYYHGNQIYEDSCLWMNYLYSWSYGSSTSFYGNWIYEDNFLWTFGLVCKLLALLLHRQEACDHVRVVYKGKEVHEKINDKGFQIHDEVVNNIWKFPRII